MRTVRIISLTGLLLLAGACSLAERERLMHFFFEIPDQADGPATQGAETGASTPSDSVMLTSIHTSGVFHHTAIRAQNCFRCHQSQEDVKVDDALMMSSCQSCHSRYFGDEVAHSPVSDGDCLLCHTMHRSEYSGLLLSPMPTLCTDCHGEPEDLSQPAHEETGVGNCVKCHDPHFGDNHLLKADHRIAEGNP